MTAQIDSTQRDRWGRSNFTSGTENDAYTGIAVLPKANFFKKGRM